MKTQYPNFISKVLLSGGFSSQFAFPIVSTAFGAKVFELVEKCLPQPENMPEVRAPIFVIGLPRTGSTWLQTLLCSHPDLGYFTHWMHHFRKTIRGAYAVSDFLKLDAWGERFIGDSVVNSLHGASEGLAFWGEWFSQDPACLLYDEFRMDDLDAATIEEIRSTIATALAQFPGQRRFFCKNPGFIPYSPVLAELFPDAYFIHLVRDPRPTANSMVKLWQRCDSQLRSIRASGKKMAMNLESFVPYPRLPRLAEYVDRFGAGNVRTTARLWRDSLLYMGEKGDRLPNLLTVRFESILADPQGCVNRILEFCGLEPFAPGNAAFASLCAKTGHVSHVNTYGEFGLISEVCHQTMTLLGYDPDSPAGGCVAARQVPAPREYFGEIL
ncbi:MAG: sulfotransferase [Desulfovibrio sp.]|nr:sulfotransferase [Desulfovibrio sp.]MBI4958760.1 sulfotransferase [Desulfovibrio sp.]